ncbi:MAG: TonB-dependent receptor [Rikenellaceae bacterium]|nr:TonB-dependent receptor [Rikenellaceae bacterium]
MAYGQHDPYEVLFNGTVTGELDNGIDRPVFTSEELFLVPLSGQASLFNTVGSNMYMPVKYSRQGMRHTFTSVGLMGIDISGSLNTASDYNLWSALHRSKLIAFEETDAVLFTGGSLATSRISYGFSPVAVPERTSLGLFVTDRKGRAGFKGSVSGTVRENYTYMVDIYRKWGRDATVKGVFTDRTAWSAGISAGFGTHRLTVFTAGDYSQDGLRSYITGEAAVLAGSNYYNPSWGYQNGKVRNSRVAEGAIPVTVLSYEVNSGRRVSVTAAASYRGGEKAVCGLSWLDAATPYPDYYRYMPSYASSNIAESLLIEKWRSGDMSVRQVDWTALYEINSANLHTAVYTLSQRVERTREYQGIVSAKVKIDERTSVNMSLRAVSDKVRRMRRMKDLLGGMAPEDIDQYLYEDGIYGDRIMNNSLTPGRKINEGDIFGYNYDITAVQAEGTVSVNYKVKGLTLDGTASYTRTSYLRNGKFEKEIYPGGLSYGRSRKIKYETFAGEISIQYALSPVHVFELYAHAGTLPQTWSAHFITPMYSNRTTGVDKPFSAVHLQGGYTLRRRSFAASVSAFYTAVSSLAETYNYWDDIASVYSTMLLENIGEVNRGIEVSADWDFSPGWNLGAIAGLGSYKYSKDPKVTIYSETTLESYISGAVSYLRGFHTAVSPESFLNARLRYSRSGFAGTLAVNYAGGRYASPSPLRRMQRAYNLALSDETRKDFVSQEKLGDAFTLDMTFLKSFRIKANYLSLFLSVSNILNDRGIVYGAYEQLRIARTGSGVTAGWKPFGNKYLYAYGRSYYCSLTVTF